MRLLARYAVTLALVAARGRCAGPARPGPLSTAVTPMSTIIPVTTLYHATQSGYRTATQLVVTDATAWRTAWAGIPGGAVYAEEPAAPPAVDFAHETAVLIALGERASGGFDIRVDSAAVAADGAVEVRATRTSPGPRCMSAAVITSPVVAARVGVAGRPVRVAVRDVASAC